MNSPASLMAFLGVLLTLGQRAAAQNIAVNGSFENYGGFGFPSNIGAGLTGWNIGQGGGIDIVFSTGVRPLYWQAANGNVSLSLSFFGPESVSQTLVTTPGVHYEVSFAMAAEIYGGPALRTMDVLWNGAVVGSPTFAYTGQEPEAMGWTRFQYDVLGHGSDVLTFQGTTFSNYGPALDDVSVTLVPEPTVLRLAAAGAIGLAWVRERRRRA